MDSGSEKKGIFRRGTARSSITPGFEGGDGGGERPNGLRTQKEIGGDNAGTGLAVKNDKAADDLRAGETDAAENSLNTQPEDSLAGARGNEEVAGGYYTGAGRAKNDKNKKKGIKGILNRKLATAVIIAVVFGAGVVMSGLQLGQPFGIVANFTERRGSMHASTEIRSGVFFRMQMNPNSRNVKNPTKMTFFGKEKFKVSKNQASRLSQQGVYYEQDFEGTGVSVLKFDDGTGNLEVIAVGGGDVDEVNAKLKSNGDLVDSGTGMKYHSSARTFDDVYKHNADFRNGYNKGSLTWRGKISGWFGSITERFLSSNAITRNLFKNYIEKLRAAREGNTRTVALDMIGEEADKVNGVDVTTSEGEVKENADREPEVEIKSDTGKISGGTRAEIKAMKLENVKEKLEAIGGKFSGKVSGAASGVANLACVGLSFLGAVSAMVAASEATQIIGLTAAFMESVDKVKAGDGDASPINELAMPLNETKKNTNVILAQKEGATVGALNDYGIAADVNENGIPTLESKEVTTEKTAMQAGMMASFFGGGQADPNDASIQSFNLSASMKRVLGGIGSSVAAFKGCSLAKMTAGMVQTAASAFEIAGCIAGAVASIFSGGLSLAACSGLAVDFFVGVGVGIAATALIGGIIATITPKVKSMLTRDLIGDIGGEDLGNALAIGANMYLGGTHRSNGGSLMTRDKYVEYAAAQQQVIAEDAKYERATKDPFDVTSKYTFLGTLMGQMMNFSSANSLTSVIKSSSAAVKSSIIGLMPTTSATNIAEELIPESQFATACPNLDSIGAVGDAACQQYIATDVATINDDPSEVIEKLNDNFLDDLTSDGNVKIKANSDLAKYILFCNNRESLFGVADQNIVNEVSSWGSINTGSEFDNVTNAAIGAAPAIGDFIDIVSNAEALANVGYVTGESCVAGNTVTDLEAPDWNTGQYYQRFIEDQSLAETMGVIEESAVTAFLDDYRKEHPLDNSYEGILARKSGLLKEDVVAILDILEYGEYLANYDPAERYSFGAPAVEVETELRFNNDNVVANQDKAILADKISFRGLRNRSFAV